jgi:retron-type reverse transcriptase
VGDKRLLRPLIQWLKVGIYDDSGKRLPATLGTAQGAVISPLLANIYLHYSFDLRVAQYRKRLKSDMTVVRYADDSVLGFQKHADAGWFLHFLKERLAQFGLNVQPDKTRLVRFG